MQYTTPALYSAFTVLQCSAYRQVHEETLYSAAVLGHEVHDHSSVLLSLYLGALYYSTLQHHMLYSDIPSGENLTASQYLVTRWQDRPATADLGRAVAIAFQFLLGHESVNSSQSGLSLEA
jgi:hypothetical protein